MDLVEDLLDTLVIEELVWHVLKLLIDNLFKSSVLLLKLLLYLFIKII